MSNPETVAVIDVGSNSIKLLVARRGTQAGSVETAFVETIETRISQGISRQLPSLTEEAMETGLKTIAELLHLAHTYHPEAIQIVATSAVRDAINGMDFIASVSDVTGIDLRVLSGIEEATYIGRGLSCDPQIAGMDRFIQMDIGGGSLELIRFNGGQIEQALSLQLGAVRLTERFVEDRDGPISPATEAAIRNYVEATLKNCGFNFSPFNDPLIVTGGAFVITRAILAAHSGKTIDTSPPLLTQREIRALKEELVELPLHERIAVPHLPASRADIIPTALITIEQVLKQSQREQASHSFYNLRYGIAAEMLG